MADDQRQSLGTRVRGRLGSWWIIVIFGVIFIASQITIASILHELGAGTVLRLQTTLSAAKLADGFERWRDAGLIDVYWRHYWFDFPHPVWYGVVLSAMLAKSFDANGVAARYDWMLLVPLVAAALDLVENLCHVLFLSSPATIVAPPVVVSGLSAIGKWSLVGVSLLTVGGLGLRRVVARRT